VFTLGAYGPGSKKIDSNPDPEICVVEWSPGAEIRTSSYVTSCSGM